ncbi:MAG: hypothetical protein M1272_04765 [Firmicutes bacterium]|nr:hypothetical protein [Bacillota bacterium]
MKQLINHFVCTQVLQIIGPVDANQWVVSAGHDSEGYDLKFVATIRPAVRSKSPDVKTGDFIQATVTTAQYLDKGGELSARSAISALHLWDRNVFIERSAAED